MATEHLPSTFPPPDPTGVHVECILLRGQGLWYVVHLPTTQALRYVGQLLGDVTTNRH